MTLLYFVLITLLLALAVKQVSYALASGSIFDGMRSSVLRGVEEGRLGFALLNELLTCKLCLTMQSSLWLVMAPVAIYAHQTDLVGHMLGEPSALAAWTFLLVGSFAYAMGVSGLGLALWIFLEYPAKRYEDAMFKLELTRQELEDLRAQHGIEAPAESDNAPARLTFTREHFREMMNYVNRECRGIGCGYARRTCRMQLVSSWVRNWSAESTARQRLLARLRASFEEVLPDYFRRYSKHDVKIENERAFLRAYQSIIELAA